MKRIIAWIVLGIGAWLVFWNPIDYLTQGIDYGIWDTSIITGGWLSMLVGAGIIFIMAKRYRQVLF